MVVRSVKRDKFENLKAYILEKAYNSPASIQYEIGLAVNDSYYILKLQPEKHCRLAILQAVLVNSYNGERRMELITNNNILGAFLEIAIFQWLCELDLL